MLPFKESRDNCCGCWISCLVVPPVPKKSYLRTIEISVMQEDFNSGTLHINRLCAVENMRSSGLTTNQFLEFKNSNLMLHASIWSSGLSCIYHPIPFWVERFRSALMLQSIGEWPGKLMHRSSLQVCIDLSFIAWSAVSIGRIARCRSDRHSLNWSVCGDWGRE
jgi:hypothetical protein